MIHNWLDKELNSYFQVHIDHKVLMNIEMTSLDNNKLQNSSLIVHKKILNNFNTFHTLSLAKHRHKINFCNKYSNFCNSLL